MERIEIGERNIKTKICRIISLLALLCIMAGCSSKEEGSILLPGSEGTELEEGDVGLPSLEEEEPHSSGGSQAAQIYVQVSGQVVNPGVYTLPPDARIFQAIELAGGLTDAADAQSLNQAEPLLDGQMVYVMSQEEAAQAAAESLESQQEGQGGSQEDGRVNLNTATESDLMSLPGIGAAKAKSILAWREENGGFSQIEDLMKIQGIKEGVFSKIKDSIKVE